MNFERSSGILLHPTSLPGKHGIGTLGKEAYKFVDFLIESGQKLWQTYPLGPTGYGDSPYQCFSAFAGNPLLIDLDILVEEKLLHSNDIIESKFDDKLVDFGKVINFKMPILKKAFSNFTKNATDLEKTKFEAFYDNNKSWLEDYSLFMALKEHFGGKSWTEWDKDIKFREEEAIEKYEDLLKEKMDFQNFIQYLFFKQWAELKAYANQNYIKIIGDIPIFVAFDSADAWSNPDIFLFDKDRNPVKVAGVPPDFFSATGQLWGNPLYDWNALEKNDFAWWIERVKANLTISDIIRVDHFRGFAGYWAVPADEDTAMNGKWEKALGTELFTAIEDSLGVLPIIAEDLGVITPDVEELRDHFNFPGMKILQFAFTAGEDSNYLPHQYPENSVVYTGTHDNDTTLGWYEAAETADQEFAKAYLNSKDDHICDSFIRACWSSPSVMAIAPLQDILKLDGSARINTPGKASGNWQWRFSSNDLNSETAKELKQLTKLYFR